MKKIPFILILLFTLLGCEKEEEFPVKDFDEGNLVVSNSSGQELLLYRGDEFITKVPNSPEFFIVEVPVEHKFAVDLKLYPIDDRNNPYKTWFIALEQDNEIEHRKMWWVQSGAEEVATGTLVFSYAGGTPYQVDILLDEKTGAPIATLAAGQENTTIGIDYDTYSLNYRYWESDQNDANPNGTEVGWIDQEKVDGRVVSIWVVLKADRPERYIQVPHWGGINVQDSQYGNLKIYNNTSEPITIWSGSTLIENIVYLEAPTDEYSTIAAGENSIFTIPVETHEIVVKSLTGQELKRKTFIIEAEQDYEWTVTY